MSDVLAKINDHKQTEVAALKQRYSLADLSELCAEADEPRGFEKALETSSQQGYGLIAELKKASPSKGLHPQRMAMRGAGVWSTVRKNALNSP